MNWVPSQTFSASDGHYQLRETHGYFAHLVRIEADGYLVADSRDIKSTEGDVTIDFALKRGQDIIAKVVTPRTGPRRAPRSRWASRDRRSTSRTVTSTIRRRTARDSRPTPPAASISRRRKRPFSS